MCVCTIKDRNYMDLTEAEDIKKRWQEYAEELFKKYLHDPDNHNVITHLEPDILECESQVGLRKCREPAREIPPMTRSSGRDLTRKVDQDLRDPMDLLEHLPQNQNLSVLLFYVFTKAF